jgi:glycosyltransferase involved in cell wall biosynthesis
MRGYIKSQDNYTMKPVESWDSNVSRVLIHAANYLEFDGKTSAGGRQRYIRDLATVIRDIWNRDVVIVQKGAVDFDKKCESGFRVIGIKSNLSAKGDISFSNKFRKLVENGDGVLYASGEDAWPYFVNGSKAIQHGVWWDGPQSAWIKFVQKKRAIACMNVVRSMLCVDTNYINWLRGQGVNGINYASKCVYIPNYADLSKLMVSRVNKTEPISIICARRYEEKRGIKLFVEALATLKNKRLPFTAHISTVGGIDKVRSYISDHHLSTVVTVSEDDMDTVLTRYGQGDVAVVPTIWSEGTSMACVEAICAGLPVVATPVGGLGNLVIPEFNGYLVDPNPSSIAIAIEKFRDLQLLASMRTNCLSLRKALSLEAWQRRVLSWLKQ